MYARTTKAIGPVNNKTALPHSTNRRWSPRGIFFACASAFVVIAVLSVWWMIATRPISDADLYDLCIQNIAHVKTERSTGTGFLVREGRFLYLYTCEHCVASREPLDATLTNGKRLRLGDFELAEGRDMARFVVLNEDEDLKGLQLGAPEDLRVDTEIVAYGDSLGEGVMTANPGKLIAIGGDKIEVDATVLQGNSGGPVVTRKGRVVGVVSSGSLNHSEFTEGTRYDGVRRFAERIGNESWLTVDYRDYRNGYVALQKSKLVMATMEGFVSKSFWDKVIDNGSKEIKVQNVNGYGSADSETRSSLEDLIGDVNMIISAFNQYLEFRKICSAVDVGLEARTFRFPATIAGRRFATYAEWTGYATDNEVMYRMGAAMRLSAFKTRCFRECDETLAELSAIGFDYHGMKSSLREHIAQVVIPALEASGGMRQDLRREGAAGILVNPPKPVPRFGE